MIGESIVKSTMENQLKRKEGLKENSSPTKAREEEMTP